MGVGAVHPVRPSPKIMLGLPLPARRELPPPTVVATAYGRRLNRWGGRYCIGGSWELLGRRRARGYRVSLSSCVVRPTFVRPRHPILLLRFPTELCTVPRDGAGAVGVGLEGMSGRGG